FFKRDKKPPDPPSPPSQQQTANPTVHQTANPVINVNIGNKPPEEPQRLKPSWDQIKRTLEATDGGKDIPRPNLTFLSPKTMRIGFAVDDWKRWFHEGNMYDPWALVARFANDPPAAKKRATYVAAQILYFDAQKNEIGRVFRGCWLDSFHDEIDFQVSETHSLLLAIHYPRNRGGLVAPYWKRRVGHADVNYSGNVEKHSLDESLSSIEIRLISGSQELMRDTCKFSMDGDKPSAVKVSA